MCVVLMSACVLDVGRLQCSYARLYHCSFVSSHLILFFISLIQIGTVGHTIAHFLNFAFAPTVTYSNFGISPFLTGGILCVTVLLIFSAARDNTRRGQFEIFWYSHHSFVVFFIVQLFHGKNSLNPNYWKWFVGPGILYFLERCLRIYRANQKVVVLSVTMMDDVFSLEFAKEGVFETPYKEGQYMFIQSPALSQIQWHPFTIVSGQRRRKKAREKCGL